MTKIMENYYCILDIMNKLTHEISIDVDFDHLKPHLVPIFTPSDLQRAEGRHRANVDIMIKVCEVASHLSMPDFVKFCAAVKVDYGHIFDKISSLYREKRGRDLPTVQELENERMASSLSTSYSQQQFMESSSSCMNAPFTFFNVYQSGGASASQTGTSASQTGTSASQTGSSSNLVSAEIMETNSVSSKVTYVSYGSAVACPSDQISSEPTVCQSSAQLPLDTAGSSQAFNINSTLESLMLNQNLFSPNTLSKYEKKMRENPLNAYRMDCLPRGYCIIINNEQFVHLRERKGSHEDYENLNRMFTFLGFEVFLYKDKTAMEIKQLLRTFAKFPILQEISALAVVILSHGGDNDCIFGSDGAINETKPVEDTFIKKFDLQQIFISRNCPLMEGKPKLFIIQACRGAEEDKRDEDRNQQLSTDYYVIRGDQGDSCLSDESIISDGPPQENFARAETADMCFLHSASLGYKAYRSIHHGSPFVKNLTEVVIRSAHKKSLQNIVMDVQNNFSERLIGSTKMTMPDYSTSLTKKWYLNPPRQSS